MRPSGFGFFEPPGFGDFLSFVLEGVALSHADPVCNLWVLLHSLEEQVAAMARGPFTQLCVGLQLYLFLDQEA